MNVHDGFRSWKGSKSASHLMQKNILAAVTGQKRTLDGTRAVQVHVEDKIKAWADSAHETSEGATVHDPGDTGLEGD